MNTSRYQAGMSFYGMLVVLALVIFFGLLTIKLAPVYLDNFKIQTAIEKLGSQDEEGAELTESGIRKALSRQFSIEMIEGIAPEDITVTEDAGVISVEIDYEVRVPLFYNIDAVVSFHDVTDVKR